MTLLLTAFLLKRNLIYFYHKLKFEYFVINYSMLPVFFFSINNFITSRLDITTVSVSINQQAKFYDKQTLGDFPINNKLTFCT